MYRCIPRYIVHDSRITLHLIKHGLITDGAELKGNWYFDIKLNKIVLEDFKTEGK